MTTILGQQHALDILSAAVGSGRVHHAWIFSGPKGVGKLTAAVEFAKVLLDPDLPREKSVAIEPDESSETSRLIDAGLHPDMRIIRKELARDSAIKELEDRKLMNIPLDVLREHLLGGKTGDDKHREAPAYRSAARGHGKVFIIDEAELIQWEGQHALLKTLEEPPRDTYIILVTSRPDRLFTTIRSRCQHVRFGPLDETSMRQWLEHAAKESAELGALAGEARLWLERFAAGSPGTALLAARYGFYDWSRALAPMLRELAAGRYPPDMGAALGQLVEDFAQRWVKDHENASKDAANKDGARHMFTLLAGELQQQLRQAVARGSDVDSVLAAIDLVREAEEQMNCNVNLKLLLENLVVQWARQAA
jgi:DNA polymerase-3 subunit delta'